MEWSQREQAVDSLDLPIQPVIWCFVVLLEKSVDDCLCKYKRGSVQPKWSWLGYSKIKAQLNWEFSSAPSSGMSLLVVVRFFELKRLNKDILFYSKLVLTVILQLHKIEWVELYPHTNMWTGSQSLITQSWLCADHLGDGKMWRSGYQLENKMRSPFISESLAHHVLRAGKSLNFLRWVCFHLL
jgi:hypothetical protein